MLYKHDFKELKTLPLVMSIKETKSLYQDTKNGF